MARSASAGLRAVTADLMGPLGADVSVLAGPPGSAATRKLIRSVFVEGMAAALVEAVAAAREAGCEQWLREQAAEFTGADARQVDRLIDGSVKHARRRSHEMAAACELLAELGVPARVSAASRDRLSGCAVRRADATPGNVCP